MRIVLVMAFVGMIYGPVFGQTAEPPPQETEALKALADAATVGTRVTVVRDGGTTLRGTINAIQTSELVLRVPGTPELQRIALSDVVTVVHNDALSNGAKIGFLWGLVAGAVPGIWIGRICAYEGILAECVVPMIGVAAAAGGLGAAVGAGIDASRRRTIYRRPPAANPQRITVAPMIAPGRTGMWAQVSF